MFAGAALLALDALDKAMIREMPNRGKSCVCAGA
jgi:hypothetical protein